MSQGMAALREDLLAGRGIALAGDVRDAIRDRLARLGARLEVLTSGALDLDEDAAQDRARTSGPLHALVYDAQAAFGAGGPPGLQAAVEAGWIATRAVATAALIPGEGGAIVLIGPGANAGPHAPAAGAALENLARTLSVEWARFAVTVTMIAPGRTTSDDELATLVAFLVSAAGEYYTGCRFDLGVVGTG